MTFSNWLADWWEIFVRLVLLAAATLVLIVVILVLAGVICGIIWLYCYAFDDSWGVITITLALLALSAEIIRRHSY